MKASQNRAPFALRHLAGLAGITFLAVGCNNHHRHPGSGSGGGPLIFEEREPNDDPFFGDFIGPVDTLSHLYVDGFVDDDPGPSGDIYDHFEFVTEEAASFEVRLEPLSNWAEVALGVFDPDSGEMVLWVDDPGGVQWADFTVHEPNKAFVLVVAATYGYGSYELELLGHNYNPLFAPEHNLTGNGEARPAIEPLDPSMDLRNQDPDGEPDGDSDRDPKSFDVALLELES